jgi:pyruvate,orthophosphate dikinase
MNARTGPGAGIVPIGYGAAADADAAVIGLKAHGLLRMAQLGLPVPQGFVLDTGWCRESLASGGGPPVGLGNALAASVRGLELASGLAFGGARKPLLVSVRSGAPMSMPGMMETVLNVGLNDATVHALLRLTGNPRLAWDSYRRLVQSFAEIVHGCGAGPFDALVARELERHGLGDVRELDFRSLERLTRANLDLFEELAGRPFPQPPLEQLGAAVAAVFDSWNRPKAAEYRRLNAISEDIGMAVTVQRMVYGNSGGTSGAGVAFTRDPATGENRVYLDFLFNAQGEDVVSGRASAGDAAALGSVLPEVERELMAVAQRLEREFHDLQEFEFTVQDGRLFLLQTRSGKRTPWAALRIAVEQVAEGLITEREAAARLAGLDLASIEQLRIDDAGSARRLARGVAAGLGVASGPIALDPDAARQTAAAGRPAILVRDRTKTEDIAGIAAAAGLLTAAGGRTSHAAVVARHMGKVCVVGCGPLEIDLGSRRCAIGGEWLREGETISLDGNAGDVYAGAVRVVVEKPAAWLAQVARWRA